MAKKLILPQPSKEYNQDEERIRNREIDVFAKSVTQKLAELEERIKALEP